MTKRDLQRLRSLKKSIEGRRQDANKMQRAIDGLSCRQTGTPPQGKAGIRAIGLCGAAQSVSHEELLARLHSLKQRLDEACAQEQTLYFDVMDWLVTVEPCDLREALKLHYVQGCTWQDVAQRQSRSYDAVKQQVYRFFK